MNELASPSVAGKILQEHNFRCRKSMGQNFLVDGNIVDKIIASARLEKDDIVVEIGAGLGVITKAAALKSEMVVAIELDKNLLLILKETLQESGNVRIVAGNALDFDFDELVQTYTGHSGSYKIIANLPYHITTPLIMHLVRGKYNISYFVLMVQAEVAERIAALPGGKDYGALSVAVQYYTKVEYLFRVPGSVFIPRPEVDSAVIRLTKREKPAVEVPDEDLFFKIVRGSFGQRRKKLLNAIGSEFSYIPRDKLRNILLAAGVDPGRRGETLRPGEFAEITRQIYSTKRV